MAVLLAKGALFKVCGGSDYAMMHFPLTRLQDISDTRPSNSCGINELSYKGCELLSLLQTRSGVIAAD